MIKLDLSNVKILVCCHKQCSLPEDPLFLPIQVGSSISNTKLNMQSDDSINGKICENISDKNKSYCELTALYWAWKNIKQIYPNIQYIGLNHYRRFFDFGYSIEDRKIVPENKLSNYKINKKSLINKLKKNAIIVPPKSQLNCSLAERYCFTYHSEDYRKLRDLIKEKYSDYYKDFITVLEKNNKFSLCNMFVMSIQDFDNYCSWLFAILQDLEKLLDISTYSDYQKRIYGYLAERLLNVYLFHLQKNKRKINYATVLFYTNEYKDINLYQKFKVWLRTSLSFKIRYK